MQIESESVEKNTVQANGIQMETEATALKSEKVRLQDKMRREKESQPINKESNPRRYND